MIFTGITISLRIRIQPSDGAVEFEQPTLAGLMLLVGLVLSGGCVDSRPIVTSDSSSTLDQGGIVRASRANKQLALVFTGSAHGEGTAAILDALESRSVKASFFVTGEYLAAAKHRAWLQRMVADGHYLGPHSHGHLLYSPWEDRTQSLVTEQEFKEDLRRNLAELRKYGACRGAPVYFIPPYEWYNAGHVQWARDLDCVLFSFTPGGGSHRDWAPEGHRAFRPAAEILADILACEERQPDGLNGHLLLLHLGSARRDKMHPYVGPLIDALRARGYEFLRVDLLLDQVLTRIPMNRKILAGIRESSRADGPAEARVNH